MTWRRDMSQGVTLSMRHIEKRDGKEQSDAYRLRLIRFLPDDEFIKKVLGLV